MICSLSVLFRQTQANRIYHVYHVRKLSYNNEDHVGASGLITQIDKKISKLVQERDVLEKQEQSPSVSKITAKDLLKLDVSDDLAKLKEIQRERLLEDMSVILNDKIKELEQKEKSDHERENVLKQLNLALNEKIEQLEIVNKKLADEKLHSEELNKKLVETIKKLEDAEKELKIERDWLADQVEKKSMEVLSTIDQLIKAENKTA